MEKTDTISVMKIIKGTAKLTYDVDGLLSVTVMHLFSVILFTGSNESHRTQQIAGTSG